MLSARIASGEDETFPGEFVDRLLSGEHPLTVWREYRRMTRAAVIYGTAQILSFYLLKVKK